MRLRSVRQAGSHESNDDESPYLVYALGPGRADRFDFEYLVLSYAGKLVHRVTTGGDPASGSKRAPEGTVVGLPAQRARALINGPARMNPVA